MKYSFLVLLNLAALLAAGCASTPTKVDSGPIHATTFNFVARSGSLPEPGFADNRAAVHAVLQAAISQNLATKGVAKVDAGGDVIVAYLVIIGNNAMTESINTYFGYGRNASALHDLAQDAYSSSKNPSYFKAGTLLIDIIDAKTYKLLKRAYVTRPVLSNPSAEVQAANIQEAVDVVLKDVQVVH
jgi:hypothetical protein